MTSRSIHSPAIIDLMLENLSICERQQVRFAETAKTPDAVAEAERGAGIYRRISASVRVDRAKNPD